MFLSTMRVDTYSLTSSAPRVFAVRRASSMSVATSFVVGDNKCPKASSVLTSSTAKLLVYTQIIFQIVRAASSFDVLEKKLCDL